MKGAVLRELDAPLTIEDVELDPPGSGMVRVQMAASGVCHTDASIINGVIPYTLPAVLGHEGAGVVTETGPGVEGLTAGDHVILSWIAPCRECWFCLRGEVTACERGMAHAGAPYGSARGDKVFAALGTATFAEETVVPERAAIRVDPSFPLDLASLIGCGVVTGFGAIVNAARVRPGETVAIIGCGGVGLSAVQAARLSGAAEVIAVDKIAAKLSLARACGATETVDASAIEPVKAVRELTSGRGADHAVEVVGLSETIVQAYGMARSGGLVTVVGAGRFDDFVSIPAMSLMSDRKRIQGCVYGNCDPARDFPRLVELAQRGPLDLEMLVSRRVGLHDVNEAFRAMAAGEVARTVLVL
jgi:S-(hydroxymethyl)glutathione dehydrogenase / alcohol dehydrogenase